LFPAEEAYEIRTISGDRSAPFHFLDWRVPGFPCSRRPDPHIVAHRNRLSVYTHFYQLQNRVKARVAGVLRDRANPTHNRPHTSSLPNISSEGVVMMQSAESTLKVRQVPRITTDLEQGPRIGKGTIRLLIGC